MESEKRSIKSIICKVLLPIVCSSVQGGIMYCRIPVFWRKKRQSSWHQETIGWEHIGTLFIFTAAFGFVHAGYFITRLSWNRKA